MKFRSCLITLLASLYLTFPALAAAAREQAATTVVEGLVVGVSDGARITVNSSGNPIHVKLYGVAAPQLTQIDKFTGLYKPGQPYGEDAFRALSVKVLHQQVRVEIRKTLLFRGDPNPVAVGVVYLDGRNINMEMLSEGWGWAFTRFMNRMDSAHYQAAERLARSRRSGLWSQEHPQPPWCFKPQLRVRLKRS